MTTATQNETAARTEQTCEMGQVAYGQISISTKMACGARQPVVGGSEHCLFFRVTIWKRGLHKICIHYNGGLDLYEVSLVEINSRTGAVKILDEADMVYAEDLSEVIYRMCNK